MGQTLMGASGHYCVAGLRPVRRPLACGRLNAPSLFLLCAIFALPCRVYLAAFSLLMCLASFDFRLEALFLLMTCLRPSLSSMADTFL